MDNTLDNQSEVARSIPRFSGLSDETLKVPSPYDLVVGESLNSSSLTH